MRSTLASCVLLLPFDADANPVYERLVEMAIKNNILPSLVAYFNSSSYFGNPEELAIKLRTAAFVVIDFSVVMPLAVWAKGYCDALTIQTILTSQGDDSDLPFNVRQGDMIKYENSKDGMDALAVQIEQVLVKTGLSQLTTHANVEMLRSGQMPD